MDGLRVHLRPAARLPSQLSKAPASPVAPPGTTPGVLVHREAPLDVRPRLPPKGAGREAEVRACASILRVYRYYNWYY